MTAPSSDAERPGPAGRGRSGTAPGRVGASALVAIGLAGQMLAYALLLFVARLLAIDAFEAFVVAPAAFMVMIAVAPVGTERLALRGWPE